MVHSIWHSLVARVGSEQEERKVSNWTIFSGHIPGVLSRYRDDRRLDNMTCSIVFVLKETRPGTSRKQPAVETHPTSVTSVAGWRIRLPLDPDPPAPIRV